MYLFFAYSAFISMYLFYFFCFNSPATQDNYTISVPFNICASGPAGNRYAYTLHLDRQIKDMLELRFDMNQKKCI